MTHEQRVLELLQEIDTGPGRSVVKDFKVQALIALQLATLTDRVEALKAEDINEKRPARIGDNT